MLQRKILEYLRAWREEKQQECLLIKGARQVGKTYVVNEFGTRDYQSFISIDFIAHPEIKAAFDGPLDFSSVYSRLSLIMPGIQFIENNTLLFLDEIQECPQARTALKYLAQDPRIDVIASGSLLGIQYRQTNDAASIPVGYERQVTMQPLDFEEFLWALGYGSDAIDALEMFYRDLVPVPQPVHDTMMRRVREYLAIGGMPAVVQAFIDSSDFGIVHGKQRAILDSYLDDIARYASSSERVKARACYMSLPQQLAKENTKFQYSVVEKGGSARKFEGAVDWLVGAHMVRRCNAVSAMQFPLAAYAIPNRFRLYANDTGLLMAMYGFEMKAAVINNTLKGPMKGGLYENLAAVMLGENGVPLHYWMSESANSEIEFLAERNGAIEPIEVKASRGATASMNEALLQEHVVCGYKLIDGNVGKAGKKITLPHYLAMFLYR